MNDKRAADEGMVGGVPKARREEEASGKSRIILPRAPSVQPLGDRNLEAINYSDWDEVYAAPLPCGHAVIVCRKGNSLRIGTAPVGPRVPCSSVDVGSLIDDVSRLYTKVARLQDHISDEAWNLKERLGNLERQVAQLESVVETRVGTLEDNFDETFAKVETLRRDHNNVAIALRAYVEGCQRVGVAPHRNGQDVPDNG